jgi:hypothetical protein
MATEVTNVVMVIMGTGYQSSYGYAKTPEVFPLYRNFLTC